MKRLITVEDREKIAYGNGDSAAYSAVRLISIFDTQADFPAVSRQNDIL